MAFIGSVGQVLSYVAPVIYYPVAAVVNVAKSQAPTAGFGTHGDFLSLLHSHPTGAPIQPGIVQEHTIERFTENAAAGAIGGATFGAFTSGSYLGDLTQEQALAVGYPVIDQELGGTPTWTDSIQRVGKSYPPINQPGGPSWTEEAASLIPLADSWETYLA